MNLHIPLSYWASKECLPAVLIFTQRLVRTSLFSNCDSRRRSLINQFFSCLRANHSQHLSRQKWHGTLVTNAMCVVPSSYHSKKKQKKHACVSIPL